MTSLASRLNPVVNELVQTLIDLGIATDSPLLGSGIRYSDGFRCPRLTTAKAPVFHVYLAGAPAYQQKFTDIRARFEHRVRSIQWHRILGGDRVTQVVECDARLVPQLGFTGTPHQLQSFSVRMQLPLAEHPLIGCVATTMVIKFIVISDYDRIVDADSGHPAAPWLDHWCLPYNQGMKQALHDQWLTVAQAVSCPDEGQATGFELVGLLTGPRTQTGRYMPLITVAAPAPTDQGSGRPLWWYRLVLDAVTDMVQRMGRRLDPLPQGAYGWRLSPVAEPSSGIADVQDLAVQLNKPVNSPTNPTLPNVSVLEFCVERPTRPSDTSRWTPQFPLIVLVPSRTVTNL